MYHRAVARTRREEVRRHPMRPDAAYVGMPRDASLLAGWLSR
jgi:hypothetical protein